MGDEYKPHVLSEEEIELYLKGDRREVDRLILYSLNRLAAANEVQTLQCAQHKAQAEEWDETIMGLGGTKAISDRARFVDAMILRQEKRRAMMERVIQAAWFWVIPAFLAFVAASMWDSIISAIKARLGGG